MAQCSDDRLLQRLLEVIQLVQANCLVVLEHRLVTFIFLKEIPSLFMNISWPRKIFTNVPCKFPSLSNTISCTFKLQATNCS